MNVGSNLTNKYNPQEHDLIDKNVYLCSNLTNKYNPQERLSAVILVGSVQILPINTILKNKHRTFKVAP